MAFSTKPITPLIAVFALSFAAPLLADDYDPVLLSSGEQIDAATMVVHVELEQEEIATNVDIGRVAPSMAAGLIDALIISGIDRDRRRKQEEQAKTRAEAMALDLRTGLNGFDVQALAWDAARNAFEASDFCDQDNLDACENATAPRGTVRYSYGLSPDFTQIRVVAEFAYLPAGADRDAFRQSLTSIVELEERSYEEEDNVKLWAANDAALAKAALAKAFARIGTLIPALVSIDEDAFSILTNKKRPKVFAAGFYGPALLSDDIGPIIWTDAGAIAVQR